MLRMGDINFLFHLSHHLTVSHSHNPTHYERQREHPLQNLIFYSKTIENDLSRTLVIFLLPQAM